MLHGEYGGEEGKLVIAPDHLFYQHQYVYEACKQQGIIFQIETVAPVRVQSSNQGGFVVYNFRVCHRVLGEGSKFHYYTGESTYAIPSVSVRSYQPPISRSARAV